MWEAEALSFRLQLLGGRDGSVVANQFSLANVCIWVAAVILIPN